MTPLVHPDFRHTHGKLKICLTCLTSTHRGAACCAACRRRLRHRMDPPIFIHRRRCPARQTPHGLTLLRLAACCGLPCRGLCCGPCRGRRRRRRRLPDRLRWQRRCCWPRVAPLTAYVGRCISQHPVARLYRQGSGWPQGWFETAELMHPAATLFVGCKAHLASRLPGAGSDSQAAAPLPVEL